MSAVAVAGDRVGLEHERRVADERLGGGVGGLVGLAGEARQRDRRQDADHRDGASISTNVNPCSARTSARRCGRCGDAMDRSRQRAVTGLGRMTDY